MLSEVTCNTKADKSRILETKSQRSSFTKPKFYKFKKNGIFVSKRTDWNSVRINLSKEIKLNLFKEAQINQVSKKIMLFEYFESF